MKLLEIKDIDKKEFERTKAVDLKGEVHCVTTTELVKAWTEFEPKVPFRFLVAARKAARNR